MADKAEFDLDTSFITNFGIESLPNKDKAIMVFYFMFTSLSTVGLGDLHPRNNKERIVAVFILLIGVNLTSFVIENLSNIFFQKKRWRNHSTNLVS